MKLKNFNETTVFFELLTSEQLDMFVSGNMKVAFYSCIL